MASRKQKQRFPMLSAFTLSFALCGLLTLAGNLLGLATKRQWIFPKVDDPMGLLTTSFLLLSIGLFPFLFRRNPRSDAS